VKTQEKKQKSKRNECRKKGRNTEAKNINNRKYKRGKTGIKRLKKERK
jgi:hypothetical protein